MIDWSKDWNDIQALEIDSEWVDPIRKYCFDQRIQELMSEGHLGMELWPIGYSSVLRHLKFATISMKNVVARVMSVDKENATVYIKFPSEELFEMVKQIDIDDPTQHFVAMPRCYVKVGTKEINYVVTFDLKRTSR